MRLIQFEDRAGQRRVGVVEGAGIQVLRGVRSTRELGLAAIRAGSGLHDEVLRRGSEPGPDYAGLLEEGRVLPPLDHDDPAHCLVSGTGLTHLGSAATRDRMHQQNQGDETALTDTMRIFRWGLEGGKPPAGQVGAQPEWFYKGDGEVLWQQAFLSGEDNMCHSLENLEYHHFKYAQFLRPGDVHVHYFGTATLSFADGIKAAPGDVFEIAMAEFGAPLRNGIAAVETALTPGRVVAL